MKIKVIFVITLLIAINTAGQVKYDYRLERHDFNKYLIEMSCKNQERKRVISDSDYFCGRYLGRIASVKNKTYYLVASSYVFDIKKREKTENHIFVYDSKRRYVGYYYLSYFQELPLKLYENRLYFNIEGCRSQIVIDFRNGIPRAINLSCRNMGNYYEFLN